MKREYLKNLNISKCTFKTTFRKIGLSEPTATSIAN